MEKVTKRELVEKANDHEFRLFQIEKALKQHGIEWTEEPKLKQLDQSVFDGQPKEWRFLAVDFDGEANFFESTPRVSNVDGRWCNAVGALKICSSKFDNSNWQNSLIERKELTGSDLCRKMLERGDKAVLCLVIDNKESGVKRYDAIIKTSGRSAFLSHYHYWDSAIPINNQGEPLTQSDVGL